MVHLVMQGFLVKLIFKVMEVMDIIQVMECTELLQVIQIIQFLDRQGLVMRSQDKSWQITTSQIGKGKLKKSLKG